MNKIITVEEKDEFWIRLFNIHLFFFSTEYYAEVDEMPMYAGMIQIPIWAKTYEKAVKKYEKLLDKYGIVFNAKLRYDSVEEVF